MSGLVLVPRDEAIQVAIPKLFMEMALGARFQTYESEAVEITSPIVAPMSTFRLAKVMLWCQ